MGHLQQDIAPDRDDLTPAPSAADGRLAARLLLAVVAACIVAVPVAVLAILVKDVRGPIARVDLAVADALNRFAVDHSWFVTALDWVSTVGHPMTFRLVATVAAL